MGKQEKMGLPCKQFTVKAQGLGDGKESEGTGRLKRRKSVSADREGRFLRREE